MQLVVGRVLRPHGVRGEVVVDVRTDSPAERFAVGSVLQTDPAAAGPLTIDAVRPHQGRLLVDVRGVRRPGRRRRAARGAALRGQRGRRRARRSGRVQRPPAGRPAGRDAGRRAARRGGPDRPRAGQRPAGRCGCPTAAPGLVPFVRAIVPEVDVAGGRVVVTAARGPASTCDCGRHSMRVDVDHDLPRVPGAAGAVPDRAGPGQRASSTVHVHDLREWTHDVHRTVDDTPYGGGPGMVMRPEPWGEALDAVLPDGARAGGAEPGRRAVHPGDGARAGRRAAPGVRLRPLRGHRPAGARARRRPGPG